MSRKRKLIAAAMVGCLTMNMVPVSASETGVALGAVFRIPFVGGLKAQKSSQPRFGLAVSMRQETLAGVRRFDRRNMQLDVVSIPFAERSINFRGAQFMGRDLFTTPAMLGADGESGAASSKTLLYGVIGLAVIGGVVLAVSGGSNDPDACIAIFPPPPGCP